MNATLMNRQQFGARALTLADLDQQSLSDDSAVDLNQSQLQRLGIDISNIQPAEASHNDNDDTQKSLNHFSKKYSDQTTNIDLTNQLYQFRQKIQDLQMEIGSERSDPYEMSLHSFKNNEDSHQTKGVCISEALGTNIRSQNQQKYQEPQFSTSNKYKIPNTSSSFGGASFNIPQLNSTNNKTNSKISPIGNIDEQLEYHRLKYYDSYLPEEHKILNNPLKFLKYKLYQQNRNTYNHCLDCLIH